MSAVLKNDLISVEEYLAGELIEETKHEYIDGHVYAMAGTSKNHQTIAANVLAEIHQHLKETPCRFFGSDVKVKVGHNIFFYPDVVVISEEQKDHAYYTEHPVLLVEVLSEASRKKDETTKRMAYQTLPSLREYVLIEQDFMLIEVCRRSSGWTSRHYLQGDTVYFESLNFKLAIENIYRFVKWDKN